MNETAHKPQSKKIAKGGYALVLATPEARLYRLKKKSFDDPSPEWVRVDTLCLADQEVADYRGVRFRREQGHTVMYCDEITPK